MRGVERTQEQTMSYLPMVFAVLAVLLCLRLISLSFNNSELFFDEAQYWVWAQYPDFGYFSKPPVLAWLIGLTTGVCGSDTAFCVRLGAPVLQIATAFMVFLIAKNLFDERTGFWAGITYALLPGISVSSTIISTDVPLMFFWSVALYAFIRLERGGGIVMALLLGLAIGAGLMSKYAMLYFFLCTVIYCVAINDRPHLLKSGKLWLAFLIGFACLVPNLLWNAEHDFATVSHTGDNIGWEGFHLKFDELSEFLGSQFGVFGPILFAVYLLALVQFIRQGLSREQGFLVAFSLPVLLIICIQALMNKAFANWAALTYVAATVLLADLLVNHMRSSWLKLSTAIHVVVFLAVSVAVTRAGPGELVFPNGLEPFKRTQGAAQMADFARNELQRSDYQAIVTVGRRLSSLMPYNLRDFEGEKLAWRMGDRPMDHFELKFAFQDNPKLPALFIVRDKNASAVLAQLGDLQEIGRQEIRGGEIDAIRLYRLDSYSQQNRD